MPRHLQVRYALMSTIQATIDRLKLTQAEAGKLMGVSQPRVSDIVNNKVHLFSIDTLIDMLDNLGVYVDVTVTAKHAHLR